jgi:hypothetical protein
MQPHLRPLCPRNPLPLYSFLHHRPFSHSFSTFDKVRRPRYNNCLPRHRREGQFDRLLRSEEGDCEPEGGAGVDSDERKGAGR